MANQLSRACSKPATINMAAAKRVLYYTTGTPDLVIVFKRGQFELTDYTDASFAASTDSCSGTPDFLFMLGGAPVSFGVATPTLTAQLTVEAERVATPYYGSKEAVHSTTYSPRCR